MPTEKHSTGKTSTEHKTAATSKPEHKTDNSNMKAGEHGKPSQTAGNTVGSGKEHSQKTHK